MWQERQAELLRGEIKAVLASLPDAVGLYKLLEEPLIQPRRGLAIEAAYGRPWPLLPLIVCEAIAGHYDKAIPAATVLQLFVAAGDVLDDVEDGDSSQSLSARYGPAVATNVATTLLILAERAITRLKRRGVADNIMIRVIEGINSYYTTACVGQHLDLSLAQNGAFSEGNYLKIISMKSASQIECACYIGAVLATGNQELIDTFKKFGYNLGMAAQITNDIQGIINGSDIVNRRITLPVLYALAQIDGEAHDQFKLAFEKPSKSRPDPGRIKELLFRTGAVNYAAVKLELYKQEAMDTLSGAEKAGANVERLKLFLG
jgi:geranylgeranyl pyrophosphate synthase